jgi:hypothetical protein
MVTKVGAGMPPSCSNMRMQVEISTLQSAKKTHLHMLCYQLEILLKLFERHMIVGLVFCRQNRIIGAKADCHKSWRRDA